MDTRDNFEAEFRKSEMVNGNQAYANAMLERGSDGEYRSFFMAGAWWAWQAAKEDQCAINAVVCEDFEQLLADNPLAGNAKAQALMARPTSWSKGEEVWVDHSHKDIHSRCTVCDAPWGVAYSCRVIT